MDLDGFETLTEFAVAIAGFSGLAIAIRGRDEAFGPLARFRQQNLILYGLVGAFGSTLPRATSLLGATDDDVWRISSLLFATICLLMVLVPFSARRHLTADQRAQLSRLIWVLAIGGSLVTVVALVANATGAFGRPGPGPLYLAVLWQIAMAALQFYRLLFAPRS